MPSEYITEGTLSDIFDFVKTVGGGLAGATKKNIGARKAGTALNTSSISRATRDLTMSYPVLCSDTVSPETASLITKTVERNVVSMLQMLIGSYHIKANSGIDAVKMIHTNLDNTFRAEDLIDATLGSVDTAREYGFIEAADFSNPCVKAPINYARILENCRQEFMNTCNIKYPESNFSETAVSDYIVSTTYNNTTVLKEVNTFNYGAFDQDLQRRMKELSDIEKQQFEQYKTSMNFAKGKKNDDLAAFKAYMDWKNKKDDNAHRDAREKIEDEKDLIRSRRELFTRQLIDSDVKKANEVQPTLMVFPFYYEDGSSEGKYQEFIAGVKTRLVPCSSEEIIDQVSRFNKDGVNLMNLVKATTKETSLAKEFIGGIEQAKIDAKRNSSKLSKTSPIWRSLQARSSQSGIKRLLRFKNSKNAAAAITTLVITQQEADYIAENYNVDITNPVIAREFMEKYNLLCLIIIDEQTEIAKFLYDGESYFTNYSFTVLDKENNGNDTRKLISLLNKTR